MSTAFSFQEEPFEFDHEFEQEEETEFGQENFDSELDLELNELDMTLQKLEAEEEIGGRSRVPLRLPQPRPRQATRRPPTYHAKHRRVIRGYPRFIYGPGNCICPDRTCPQHGTEYIRWVQSALNNVLGLWLPVNGIMGPETRSAVRSFQEREGLPVTGIVGPDIESALITARGGKSPQGDAPTPAEPDMTEPSEPAATPPESVMTGLAKPATSPPAAELDFEWESFNYERENAYEAPRRSRTYPARSSPKPRLFSSISGSAVAARRMPRHGRKSELMFEAEPFSFQFEYPEEIESEDLTPAKQCDTAALKAIPLLDSQIVACGSVTIPTQRVKWLLDYSRIDRTPNWVKQFKGDIAKIVPQINVTVELFRVIPVRPDDPRVAGELRKYMTAKGIPFYSGWLAELNFREKFEKELKVSLLPLYQQAGVNKALPLEEYQRYVVFVYATFPDKVKDHLRPVGSYVLDKFVFNKWYLLPSHITTIQTIARDVYESWWTNKKVTGIHIRGHTDERGSDDYNYRLGEKRARSVEERLRKEIKAKAIKEKAPQSLRLALEKINVNVGSLGEDEPVSKTVRELNRRVEVIFDYTEQTPPPSVPIDDIASRLRKLLPNQRIIDKDAAQRLLCMMGKMKPSVDDRFFTEQGVVDVSRTNKPTDPAQWPRIRYSLVNPDFFGPKVSDEKVIRNAELLDKQVIAGIVKLRQLIEYYSGIPSTGALATGKAFRTFDEWFQKQLKEPNSIYHCYKDF